MKAIVLDEERRLELRDVPEPEAAEGQVVVDVRAAGINYADVLISEGRYPQAPPLPYVPGSEVAGETADGRRVIGFVREGGGGYAERAVVDDGWVFDLPDGASYEEGAAFLLAFLTAWMPLTRQARIENGSRVLVTAAAGGVGSAGVQVARALGGSVVGAVGSPEKLDRVRALGAEAVTYEEIGDLEPFDVVLDQVGGELFATALGRLRPLGTVIGIGFAGGAWQPVDPALLVGRNVTAAGFYLGRLMKLRPDLVRASALELLEQWAAGALAPVVGATYPLAEAEDGPASRRGTAVDREGRARAVRTALVTGGASGIGAALVTRLRHEGFEVRSLDLATGFDVTDPSHWDAVGPVDVACLNAGVLGGPADPTTLSVDGYRRAVAVNVDGVVLGVRRLASVMPLGGRIVCTASLAGLTSVPDDPVYAATKHAVVGFVRSVAPELESRGITINAICPGFADTPMVAGTARDRLEAAGFPLLSADDVAEAAWVALTSGETGHAWVVQPGRPPVDFRFPTLPGPRRGDETVGLPPPLAG